MREVEKELASVKIEFQRLEKVEDELRAIRNDFTAIKIEQADLKSDGKDIKDQVDSVDHYLSECLDIVDTTAKKVQAVEESVSDLQERDVSCIVGTTSEATNAGARDGASVPPEYIDFGAAFFQRMDEIQVEVLRKTDETNETVLKRLDTVAAAVQLKLDRSAREEEGRKALFTIEAKDTDLTHNHSLECVQYKTDGKMMESIAKKMEDVLEHSMAVVSCETKLENLEKMISQMKGTEGVAGIGNRLDAKLDALEQRVVALSSQNVQEFIDIDQKFNAIMRQGDIHGLDNLIRLVSKLETTMEAFDKTLRNTSISDTSLQNILQWVQSMNGKLVDMSSKIEALSGRGKGADSIQRAITGLATKADLQYMAATFQSGGAGKDLKKDKPKVISAPVAGPSRPKAPQAFKPPVPAVSDRPKPKLATTLGMSLNSPPAKLPAAAPVPAPTVPIQAKSVQIEMTPEEMYKVHSAETVKQRAEHLAAYKKRVADEETTKAVAEAAKAEEELQRVRAESSEADVSETDSDDNVLLVRFAEMKKSMQPSRPIASTTGLLEKAGISKENAPSWFASRVSTPPITLTNATNMNGNLLSASSTPKLNSDMRASSPASSLNAQATDFKMTRSFSLGSQSPFDNWEEKTLPDVARKEGSKSPLKFADRY